MLVTCDNLLDCAPAVFAWCLAVLAQHNKVHNNHHHAAADLQPFMDVYMMLQIYDAMPEVEEFDIGMANVFIQVTVNIVEDPSHTRRLPVLKLLTPRPL